MADITAGETNDVPIGTGVTGDSLNGQDIVGYVLGVGTGIPTINGIEALGGPGGQNLRTPGSGTNSGGAGVIGTGGEAGEFEDLHETLPPGPGVIGYGGSSHTEGVQGAAGVFGFAGTGGADGVAGYGTGGFAGVAGVGDPKGDGTGVFGEGGGQGAGVRGIGAGGPNTGPSGSAGVYGQGGPRNPGVVGQAGSAPADGVQGYGAGDFSGVAGFGDPATNGTGVFGAGRGPGAQGVRGIGSGGPNVLPSSPVGVYGQGGADEAAGVWGAGGIGVLGQGSNVGAVAEGGDTGLNAIGTTVGVHGQGHTGVVAASNGQPGSIGLFASGNGANELAGEFLGEVFILGDLVVSGLKSAVVPLSDGTHRRLYCIESPESWFEDVGFGTLENGRAEITLDPDFASTVQSDGYHVFITEYDGNNALYVTERSSAGFVVRAAGEAVNASFSYRVMAKRSDSQGPRLQAIEMPTPPGA